MATKKRMDTRKHGAAAAIVAAVWLAGSSGPGGATTMDDGARDNKTRLLSEQLPALRAQVLLDRAGFSPGAIDGQWGTSTRQALEAFQRSRRLEATGELDDETLAELGADDTPMLARYRVTRDDVDGPFVDEIPEDLEAQARLEALLYTSAAEALAERFHTLPDVLRELNPRVRRLKAGRVLRVPAVTARRGVQLAEEIDAEEIDATESDEGAKESSPAAGQATDEEPSERTAVARLVVSKSRLALTVENADGEVLFYAPVTAGSEHDPLPIGDWHVKGVARDPEFHYNPDLFWDADPGDEATLLPPGPNNPVGRVWIDLDKPHYGIHGTPEPEKIGHTQSHGCVRLTNWDALEVASRVRPGTPVAFRE